jgi:hypothetical protein
MSRSLFFDFAPPLLERREGDDWVDVPYVVDTSVKKPPDWDDRLQIPDRSAMPPPGYCFDEGCTH